MLKMSRCDLHVVHLNTEGVDLVNICLHCVQWTLTYPTATGPDHGQMSEMAIYVNHQLWSGWYVSWPLWCMVLLRLKCQFLICFYKLSIMPVFSSWIYSQS